RTPADNQTVRNVFVIGPDKKVKLVLVYPMTTGRNFDGAACDRFAAAHRQAQGGDAGELAAGGKRDHRRFGRRRGSEETISAGLEGAEAQSTHRPAAEGIGSAQGSVALKPLQQRRWLERARGPRCGRRAEGV